MNNAKRFAQTIAFGSHQCFILLSLLLFLAQPNCSWEQQEKCSLVNCPRLGRKAVKLIEHCKLSSVFVASVRNWKELILINQHSNHTILSEVLKENLCRNKLSVLYPATSGFYGLPEANLSYPFFPHYSSFAVQKLQNLLTRNRFFCALSRKLVKRHHTWWWKEWATSPFCTSFTLWCGLDTSINLDQDPLWKFGLPVCN